MDTLELTVPGKYISALKLFAHKKNPILNSIFLDIDKNDSYIFATDNFVLGCFRVASPTNADTNLPKVIIPMELFKFVTTPTTWVKIRVGKNQDDLITVETDDGTITGQRINHIFPKYRKLFPDEVSGQSAQFRSEVFETFIKASHILHGKKAPSITIQHNGNNNVAIVGLQHEDFAGLAMPIGEVKNQLMPSFHKTWKLT